MSYRNTTIEEYNINPGLCICGHSFFHHDAAAWGRGCLRVSCNFTCVKFVSSTGVLPSSRKILETERTNYCYPKDTVEDMFWHSLRDQEQWTANQVQEAIERIWNS